VRLEIPASQVGLVGKTISGMAFTLDGGRATWDRSGKAIEETDFESVEEGDGNPPGGLSSMEPVDPPDPPVQETVGDFIWFDTVLPPGAHEDLSFDDVWNRVSENPCQQCGPLVHRSNLGEEARLHRHSFSGASTPMVVDPGDILFTHVNINPNARPDEIILQWNDGDGGIHRAYWGNNFLANLPIYNIGGSGTESLRYMGGLPAAGGWVRLEIPASYVGLEGKKVSGMSFGFYRDHGSSQVTWACAGKVKIPTTVPTSLHASLNLYQFFSSSLGYFYSTNDIGRSDQGEAHLFAYVFPNAAAGTVPIYRLRNSANKYLFTTAPEAADHNAWTNEGIVFHIYPRSFGNESAVASGGEAIPTIPGTLPLYLYRENAHDFYFFVTHRLAIAGVTFSNVMGYVYPDVGASVLLRGQSVTPLEDPRSFVQQQYRDFLGREPDQGGWNFWTSHILGCGNDAACVHLNRVQVSQAYYQSDEFQDSGYFVCRLYQASYNRRPNFNEFMPDRSTVVGGPNLEASKVAFVENWLARPAFQQTYPESLTAGQFVDNLNANTGNSLSPAERNALVQGLLNQTETRATALRKIADNATFRAREYNKAFVVMQYFAYLRRNPDQGGLDFWLDVINHRDPNNYFGMVCAFVTSAEYQLRFGPAVTRTDQDCMTTAVGAPPPQVTITSPETGVVFNGPAEINFDASASNADGSIVKVEFLQGGIKIGEDNTTPYSLTWANVQPGNYQVTAKATDTVGSVVMSPPVTVIVNSAPAVTITSPVNGQTFPATSTLPLSANASDPDGTVTKVEFYAGATLISADTAAPYTFSWSAVPSGVYSLTAKATDNLGATTISGAVNVTVNVVNSPPSVGISLPANNAIFTAPANLTITATAGDPDGTISQVQFYSGTTLIGTANSTPFTITWNNVSAGSYTLTARATDNLGAATTSSAVNIVVNSAPTISIISPTNNSAFTPPATIAINVAVADSDGSVTKVEFFDGPTKVGETLSSPFNFNWAVVPAGSHNLTAQASDNLGATTASSVVAFNVLPPPGGRITFTTNRDGNDEIYSMNLDGSNPVRLTNNAAIDSYSRWSPDGSKIVFASERDGNSEIYVMNADGANQTRLTNNISFDGYASWSPDGGKIAFAGDRDGNRELYVMNPDGTGQTRLTNNGATDSLPMWSPDGTRLAFHSNRDGGMMEVYVMNADGSGQTRLTNNPATDFTPAWSTNGSKIFFVSDRDGNYEVYSMNADGSGQANLTNNSAWDASSATSSPDGTKVIFISNRDGNDEVYQMNTDGSNQNRLTDNSARERYPAWQPGGIRTNVALASNGGIASASSTYNSGYAANGANNSDRKGQNWANGGGWNDATPATHPDWLQIDFAGNKVIDEVDVFTVQDSYSSPSEPTLAMTFSTYGLTGYEVQYWDGVTWITLPGAGVTSNNKVWRKFSFPAVNTARIRILTNAALADYSRITEVEAYGVAAGSMTPPSNVALSANGGTAVASSYFSNPSYGTYLPSSVNDGSRRALNNAIWLDNTNGVFPDWIEVDFNGGKTINEIDVITQQDDSQNPLEPTLTQTFSTWGIVAFEVQYWNGLNWITVPGGSVSGNNKVWRQFTFANITASKIRVLVNDAVDHIYSRVVEVEAWSPATTGQTATYQASTNFATTQGQQNWYYLDSTGAQMSFNASGGYWEGPQSYLWLWSNGGHPGPAADAVRQWRAPQSGSIHITGNVADANTTCGDGVVVSIRKGATVLWQQSIENGNTAGFSYDLITSVAAGDQINFVINRRVESNYCDGTNFDPAITLTW
jgi:Tol biopolymer transport system component